jgi:Carboxypeptidase regulatory-like domain
MRRAVVYCFILFFSLVAAAAGQSVDSQQISGSVADSSGAVVADASVTVTNVGTDLIRVVKSNADGNYIVLDLIGTGSFIDCS